MRLVWVMLGSLIVGLAPAEQAMADDLPSPTQITAAFDAAGKSPRIVSGPMTYSYSRESGIALLQIPAGSTFSALSFYLDASQATDAGIIVPKTSRDLRTRPILRFKVRTTTHVTIRPRTLNQGIVCNGCDGLMARLPPLTTEENVTTNDYDGLFNGLVFKFEPDAEGWTEYLFDLSGIVDPGRETSWRLDRLQFNIDWPGGGGARQLEIKDVTLAPSDRACTLTQDSAWVRSWTEAAPTLSSTQWGTVLTQKKFYRCTDYDPPLPSFTDGSKKFVLFNKAPGTMHTLFPDDLPKGTELLATGTNLADLAAVPGEDRIISLAVRPLQNLSNLSVRIEGLTGIGPDNIFISKIRYGFAKLSVGYVLFPNLLDPWPTTGIFPANLTRGVWIRIHVPAAAAGGLVDGTVVVEGGGETVRLPIHLTVMPIELKTLDRAFGIIFPHFLARLLPDRIRRDSAGRLAANNVVIDWLSDIRGHGLNSLMWYVGIYMKGEILPEFDPDFRDANNPVTDREMMALVNQAGFSKDLPFFWDPFITYYDVFDREERTDFANYVPLSRDPLFDDLKRFCRHHDNGIFSLEADFHITEYQLLCYEHDPQRRIRSCGFIPPEWTQGRASSRWGYFTDQMRQPIAWLRSQGWNQIIARQWDEPNNHMRANEECYRSDQFENVKHSLRMLREAGAETTGEVDPLFLDRLGTVQDIASGTYPMSYLGGYPNQVPTATVRAHPHYCPVLQYAGGRVDLTVDRSLKGLWSWRRDIDCTWGWTYWNPNGDPLNPFDGPDDGAIVATPERIISTLQWDYNREAINDYRYLKTLEAEISAHGNDTRGAGARLLLASYRGMISEHAASHNLTPQSDSFYNQMRLAIGAAILQLRTADPEPPPVDPTDGTETKTERDTNPPWITTSANQEALTFGWELGDNVGLAAAVVMVVKMEGSRCVGMIVWQQSYQGAVTGPQSIDLDDTLHLQTGNYCLLAIAMDRAKNLSRAPQQILSVPASTSMTSPVSTAGESTDPAIASESGTPAAAAAETTGAEEETDGGGCTLIPH